MEEEIEELLKRKDDYDFAYGTQIYKPYTMSEKDWELIENLLTRYKQLEEENKDLQKSVDQIYDDYQDIGKMYFNLTEKIENKIEELNKTILEYEEYRKAGKETDVEFYDFIANSAIIEFLQELLRQE